MKSFYYLSKGESDTAKIAQELAPLLKAGDAVLLKGTLAAGKTFFVKCLAHELGCKECVTSPTFAIVHTYKTQTIDLIHVDTYRLSGLGEFRDLGLDEYFEESITAIEWGDKVADDFSDCLILNFKLDGTIRNNRIIHFSYAGKRWEDQIEILKDKLGGTEHGPNLSN